MVIPYMPMLVPPVNWTGYGYVKFLLPLLIYFFLDGQDIDYEFKKRQGKVLI